jgi:hypothetical protein
LVETLQPQDKLREAYRRSVSPDASVWEKDFVAGMATGLIVSKALTTEQVCQALEEGITEGLSEWSPEIREAELREFFS